MTIITKKGDRGTTVTFAGKEVSKADPMIALNGAVDELNAHLGFARSFLKEASFLSIAGEVRALQLVLFRLGAEIQGGASNVISAQDIEDVEELIMSHEATLKLPRAFIVAGSMPASGALDIARTVARRVEREAIAAAEKGVLVSEYARVWLNRISDLLFVLARAAEHEAGVEFDVG